MDSNRSSSTNTGTPARRRLRLLTLLSIGVMGAGLTVGTAWRASATATPPDNGADNYYGGTYSFGAVTGLDTGQILVGAYSDSDGSFGLSELSGVIQWGDGSSSTAQVDDSTGKIYGHHIYSAPGQYPVTVDFTDDDEGTVLLSDNNTGTTLLSDGYANVSNADISGSSVSINPVENSSFSGVVANYADQDNSGCNLGIDVTATINWGDGSTSPGDTSVCGTISGSHTYVGDEGDTFPITVDVTDSDEPVGILPSGATGNVELSGGSATLADGTITTAATSPTLVEGSPFTNLNLGTITDADPAANVSDYSVAQTCFNDLSPNTTNDCIPAVLTPVQNHPSQFKVTGSGVFLEEGVYNVQTFISDGTANPQEVVMNTTVTVTDAPLSVNGVSTIQAKAKQSFKKVVANFTDADPHGATGDYTASINWGDGTPSTSGSIAPNGMGGWSVTGTHSYKSSNGYSVTVTVNDSGGASKSTVDVVRVK